MKSLWLTRTERLLDHSYAQVRARWSGGIIDDDAWAYYLKRWKRRNGAEPLDLLSSRDKMLNRNARGELVITRYE